MSKIILTGAALDAAKKIHELRIETFREGVKLRQEIEEKVKALEEKYGELMDAEWNVIWVSCGITFPRADVLALTVTPEGEAFLAPQGWVEPANNGSIH